MKTTQARVSRRKFLLAATAGTAATAAVIVAKKEIDTASPKDTSTQSGKGYQLSEHVRNYYRTAKI
ncbi:MAG: formate dehydrogenase [Burkholderiales bacterium]